MLKIHRWFILLGLLFIVFIALAFDYSDKKVDSGFDKWVLEFSKELEKSGVSSKTVDGFKSTVSFLPEVLDTYAVRKLNGNYRISISDELLLKAQVFFKDNKVWLDKKYEKVKISPEIVVAMFAVNSSFGEKLGDNNFVSILSSLAYNKDSTEEYTSELLAFLQLVDRGYFDISVFGNNDGTFTYIGIKPTAYLSEGVDGNADGIIDLFNTKDDIIDTSFSLLQDFGLDDKTWGNEVSLPANIDFYSKQGIKNITTLDKWQALGLTSYNKKKLPLDKRSSFLIVLEDYNHGVLLYNNFSVMLRTNSNIQRTLDILALSDKINDYKKVLSYTEQNTTPNKRQEVQDIYEEECACEEEISSSNKKMKKDDLPPDSKYYEYSLIK